MTDQTSIINNNVFQSIVKTGGTVGVDCTHTTIAGALTTANAGGPKYIFVRSGNYTETLSIPVDGITIEGESRDATVIGQTSGITAIITTTYNNFTIKNIKLSGSGTWGNNSQLINVYNTSNEVKNITIDNVYFSMTASGIAQYGMWVQPGSAPITNLHIKNCLFECHNAANGKSMGIFLWSPGTSNADIDYVYIESNTFTGSLYSEIPPVYSPAKGALFITIGADNYTRDILIANNSMHNFRKTIGSESASLIALSNYNNATGDQGIYDVRIVGNCLENVTAGVDKGIYIERNFGIIDSVTIVGNLIRADPTYHIIQINSPTNVIDVANNKV